MFNYLPLQWLFLFYCFSFFGWCFESAYVSIHEKKLVNRGFMRGPFLPLYGCGGVMMLIASSPFYDNVLLVYIAGCMGATALEYITAVVMETLFNVRYWDYSHKKFNFQGRISLESSLFWGVLTVVFSHVFNVPIDYMMSRIPYNVLTIITTLLTIYVSADFMMAFRTALDLRDVLVYMDKAKSEMMRMQKRLDVIIAFKGEEVMDSIGNKMDEFGNTRIGATIGVLSDALEKSFGKVREKINLNPADYAANVKDEVAELYTRYRIMLDRTMPSPIKNFATWYRNHTIMGNPTMVSEKFAASLEELKEKARRYDRKED
ncbi:MAG: putative ABC transporter permease [Butyrivibrio sp.]|nr:putative ABC transporter permease [Butyrivibrio sp.]